MNSRECVHLVLPVSSGRAGADRSPDALSEWSPDGHREVSAVPAARAPAFPIAFPTTSERCATSFSSVSFVNRKLGFAGGCRRILRTLLHELGAKFDMF